MFQKKNYREAESSYSAALRHDPDIAHAYAMRGLLRCELGDAVAGCNDLREAKARGISSAQKEIERFCE